MPNMGLVLQGGGALGAYEYGAVTRLVERGWHPITVTGVSIGAATAAAVAGAPDGDICKSLKRLWEAITLDPVPFWPPERQSLGRSLALHTIGPRNCRKPGCSPVYHMPRQSHRFMPSRLQIS